MVKVTSQYKTEVRERILESAIGTFSQYGFDKTRMEDIAAKLAKGTLYLYFKSKEDLFYAICERDLNKLKDQLSNMFTTKEDFLSDVGTFYDNYRKMNLMRIMLLPCRVLLLGGSGLGVLVTIHTQSSCDGR